MTDSKLFELCVAAQNQFEAAKFVSNHYIAATFQYAGRGCHFFVCGTQFAERVGAWYDASNWPIKEGDLICYKRVPHSARD